MSILGNKVITILLYRPDGTFDTDVGSGRKKREFLHKDIFSKLHQLSGAVGELSSSLISHKDMHPPRYI